jgi:adenylate cyclase class IV
VDKVLQPALPGQFIEIKSRTWSGSDAENKADRIQRLLNILSIEPGDIVERDYLEMENA